MYCKKAKEFLDNKAVYRALPMDLLKVFDCLPYCLLTYANAKYLRFE